MSPAVNETTIDLMRTCLFQLSSWAKAADVVDRGDFDNEFVFVSWQYREFLSTCRETLEIYGQQDVFGTKTNSSPRRMLVNQTERCVLNLLAYQKPVFEANESNITRFIPARSKP